MSLGIYPVFQPNPTGTKFDSLGEALAENFEALDQIARAGKLTPFTAFADNRPIPEDFDGEPDDLAEIIGEWTEWTEWFEPAEGQATMQALVDHITASPKAAERLNEAGAVVEELQEMARVLGDAATQGVRFRLMMS